MSIDGQINAALASGNLHYLSVPQSLKPRRVMLVHTDIRDILDNEAPTPIAARRLGRLSADLEMFVKGSTISMCFENYRHGDAYMGRYDPSDEGTWAIRSRKPRPSMRVFGRFAKTDRFVALNFEFRSVGVSWSDKKPLGPGNSIEHQIAMIVANKRWNQIFPGTEPIKGENVHDYISKKAFRSRA